MVPLDRQFYIALGILLRNERKKKNMSLQYVVDKLPKEYKIAKQTLSKYEKGQRRMSVEFFNALCNILELSPAEVLNSIKFYN